MTMFNTGNPIGSTAPKDLSDNAQVFDKLVNGTDPRVTDRTGHERLSWEGIEYEFENAQDGRAAEFTADQTARDVAFQNFLTSSGYYSIGDYGPGLVLSARNQYFIRDGYAYRAAPATTLPYTTTGNWALEQSNFVLFSQDDILRQDLADPTEAGRLVAAQQDGAGAVLRDVDAKLKEVVSLADFSTLRQALATGAMVRVPASVTSIAVSAADSPFVLPFLYRISAEGDLTLNLGAGVHATTTGDVARVGVRNSTIKVVGVTPVETKATAVTSITGSAGNWSVTYSLTSAASFQVGDFAKLFDVGPLPILNGDNADPLILREYPVLGELSNPPSYNLGAISTTAGGNVATFASLRAGKAVSNYMKAGDLLTAYGQTSEVLSSAGLTATVSGTFNKTVTGLPSYYVTRANAGTIGTGGALSNTIAGVSSTFLSQANPGDVLLVNGTLTKILTVPSDTSMTVDCPVTVTAGTKYSILQSAAVLHEGVHEVTAVSGNSVTLLNRGLVKPPLNGVTVDEFKSIKTVLKQNGTGDGFVFDQNGSLREVNNLVIAGPGTGGGIGFLLQSRIPSETSGGGTSFGDVTQHGLRGTVLFGENVGATRFLRGAMVGHGCLLNARKFAATSNTEHSVWVLESGFADLRRAHLQGGGIGLVLNAGSSAVVTEARFCGNGNDGMRTDANATPYGEAPMSVANVGMNFRFQDSTKCHITDGVSLLSTLSGFYADFGSARIDRCVVGANAREGVEATEGVELHGSVNWITGTSGTTGSGYGLKMGSGSFFFGDRSAFVGNKTADVAIPTNAANTNVILSSCVYTTLIGVTRVNNPTANGSAVWDTVGVDQGSSVPTVSAAGGSGGTSSLVSLNWTRDKNRYSFDAQATINTLGTWSGYLTLSLPFTVSAITALMGTNLTTGAAITGYVTGTEARLYSATGTFPLAAGNAITFSCVARG